MEEERTSASLPSLSELEALTPTDTLNIVAYSVISLLGSFLNGLVLLTAGRRDQDRLDAR